jgi:hypothetical protein
MASSPDGTASAFSMSKQRDSSQEPTTRNPIMSAPLINLDFAPSLEDFRSATKYQAVPFRKALENCDEGY